MQLPQQRAPVLLAQRLQLGPWCSCGVASSACRWKRGWPLSAPCSQPRHMLVTTAGHSGLQIRRQLRRHCSGWQICAERPQACCPRRVTRCIAVTGAAQQRLSWPAAPSIFASSRHFPLLREDGWFAVSDGKHLGIIFLSTHTLAFGLIYYGVTLQVQQRCSAASASGASKASCAVVSGQQTGSHGLQHDNIARVGLKTQWPSRQVQERFDKLKKLRDKTSKLLYDSKP